jgi:hypothetical protein
VPEIARLKPGERRPARSMVLYSRAGGTAPDIEQVLEIEHRSGVSNYRARVLQENNAARRAVLEIERLKPGEHRQRCRDRLPAAVLEVVATVVHVNPRASEMQKQVNS